MKHRHIQALCEGALMVAAAQALGYLRLYRLPNGGSITFIMLPIFLYCARWGLGKGLLASFALAVLQFLLDGGFSISWISILGDYILAYAVLGIAGIFSGRRYGFFWGTLLGSFARFLVHWIVGATVWAEYMPESFLHLPMTSPWVYSGIYNFIYIGLSAAMCLLVGLLLWRPLGRYLRGEDIRTDET